MSADFSSGTEKANALLRKWSKWRGFVTVLYWLSVLLTPSVAMGICFYGVTSARNWVKDSGWIKEPNPEFNLKDSGQLIPLIGGIVIVMTSVMSELGNRRKKARQL